ncbi:LuxR C-terminal-related transcriptional regulator [Nocardia sp. NPDC049220]|uniref:helix-turn-helix transcriptional regulator n=1 Tax=Nocardia sp. NPDC049220 TaxID=3155273 RepID=UPI0033F24283
MGDPEITRGMEDFTFGLRSREGHVYLARAQTQIARGRFRAAVADAQQAYECFQAAETGVWAAQAQLTAGRALARSGEQESAVRELELAHSSLRDFGASRLADQAARELRTLGKHIRRRPAVDVPADPAALTERERDIADRVVEGYSNREIAAELYISPKTVEKHLARVFTKLGVSYRAGVAAAMSRGDSRQR